MNEHREVNQNVGEISSSQVSNVNINLDENVSMTDKSKVKSFFYYFTFALNVIVLFFNLFYLGKYYPRTDLGIDYLGIILGILSFLVTLLIGWQILNVISIKNEIRNKIEEIYTDLNNNVCRLEKKMDSDIQTKIKDYDYHLGSILLHTKANNMATNKKNAISLYFQALECANLSSNKGNINSILSDLTTVASVFGIKENDFDESTLYRFKSILDGCDDFDNKGIKKIVISWINKSTKY